MGKIPRSRLYKHSRCINFWFCDDCEAIWRLRIRCVNCRVIFFNLPTSVAVSWGGAGTKKDWIFLCAIRLLLTASSNSCFLRPWILVYTQWKGKRDDAVLSTNCSPKERYVALQRRGRGVVVSEVVKPKVVAMYNENMGGVDQSDQMRSYYPTGRSSRKWYRYIFLFLFDVVIGNALF